MSLKLKYKIGGFSLGVVCNDSEASRLLSLLFFCFIWTPLLSAQEDSVLLTKNFKFKDGLYLDFQAFKNNQPTYSWIQLDGSLVTNPQTFITKVDYLYFKGHRERQIDLSEVWGLCLGGIPYIRLLEKEEEGGIVQFAGLQVRGKICFFAFEEEVTRMVVVKAYNPLTGRPFRTGEVPTTETVVQERMLRFEDGVTEEFNVENFLDWIQDDRQLWTTIKDMPIEEAENKLFKSLLIYDDRQSVYVKKTED